MERTRFYKLGDTMRYLQETKGGMVTILVRSITTVPFTTV